MSGAAAARALTRHFDAIRRAELERLRKKVASLSASDRAEVDAITAHIVRAIAAVPAAVVGQRDEPLLVRALMHLFGMSGDNDDLSDR